MLEVGLSHCSELVVSDDDTAERLGSGDLAVLATPRMLALMEHAAMLAVAGALPAGSTTVGAHITSSHLCPTSVGKRVKATARLIAIDGRRLTYDVAAYCGDTLLGKGTHVRVIVDRERFMTKLCTAGD